MTHPLVLALYRDANQAAEAAQAVRNLGVERRDLSIVARNHEAEGQIAERVGGSPGVEIEDSRTAAALGDLGGHLLAAIAVVLPGIGPIVAGGPLAAGLGEAAGHVAGGLKSMLEKCGVAARDAERWEHAVQGGAIMLGVHVRGGDTSTIRTALERAQPTDIASATWK
ncbi:MAG: hypothetical protein HY654_08125 [Acidobacteria bacterium]|nr:hypothetical protein [Acidobacteriota bacterium]